MEIRRIEGILLQHIVEQSQSARLEKTGKEYRVKVLSSVPSVLLELSLGGGATVRARVSQREGNLYTLTLSNGLELKAENQSSIELFVGDILDLNLQETTPLTFKITGLYRRTQIEELIRLLLEEEHGYYVSLNPEDLKQVVKNSGIFYERKLLDLFLGKLKPADLLDDEKAQILQSLLKDAEVLASMMGMNYEKNLEGIKSLIEALKQRAYLYQKIKEAFKGLFLETLSHNHYADFIKSLEKNNARDIITALEKKNLPTLLKMLIEAKKTGRELFHEVMMESLASLQEIEEKPVKDLLKAVQDGSERSIRKAYESLKEYMKMGEQFLELYRAKGFQMEQLFNRLEYLSWLQWLAVKHGGSFYLPIHYDRARGGLIFKLGVDYTVVFKLDYEEYFVGGVVSMPKAWKVVDIRIFTNQVYIEERISNHKEMLKSMLEEEGINLRSFSVETVQKEELLPTLRNTLLKESFLLLA